MSKTKILLNSHGARQRRIRYMLAIISVCITKWCRANEIFNVKNVKMRYPVSMRSLPENLKEATLDNNLTTVMYNLPLWERIDQCLDYLKNNKNKFLNFNFLTCQSYFRSIFPYLPEIVIEKMFNNSTDSVYLLFTNVPFPSEPFYIWNRQVWVHRRLESTILKIINMKNYKMML